MPWTETRATHLGYSDCDMACLFRGAGLRGDPYLKDTERTH